MNLDIIFGNSKKLLLTRILEVLKLTDGRDKSMKIIQYLVKLFLLSSKRTDSDMSKKLNLLVSSFSLCRKIIRLAHFLEPLESMLAVHEHKSYHDKESGTIKSVNSDFWNDFLSVLNDLSDDMVCFSKIGLIDKATGLKYENYSNYLWLACILIDLRDALNAPDIREKESSVVVQKKIMLRKIAFVKLVADFGFCLYDVLEFNANPRLQALCATVAALMGFFKLWIKSA